VRHETWARRGVPNQSPAKNGSGWLARVVVRVPTVSVRSDGSGTGRLGEYGSQAPRHGKGDVIWIQRARATSRDLRGRPGPKPEDDPAAYFTSQLTASRSLERGSEGHSVVSSTEPMLGEHDESRPWAIAFCVSTTFDLRPDENVSLRKQTIGGCFSLAPG
jgi:hypothetical protein